MSEIIPTLSSEPVFKDADDQREPDKEKNYDNLKSWPQVDKSEQETHEDVVDWVSSLKERIDKIDTAAEAGGDDEHDFLIEMGNCMELRYPATSPNLSIKTGRIIAKIAVDVNTRAQKRWPNMHREHPPINLLESMSPDIIASLYKEGPDEDGWSLAESIKSITSVDMKARLMKSIYGDNYRTSEDAADDPIIKEVNDYYRDDTVKEKIGLIPDMFRGRHYYDTAEFATQVRKDTASILFEIGLPKELISEYGTQSDVRLRNTPFNSPTRNGAGGVDLAKLKAELSKIHETTREIGLENIKKLHKELHLENIWAYSLNELDILLALLNKEEGTIEHMKNGDVTVEFMNAQDDYNGAIIDSGNLFKKFQDRTIRFEVKNALDIYRRMVMLNRLGIKPSVLALSAHGSPGMIGIGSEILHSFEGVPSYHDEDTDQTGIAVSETALGRLVRDYMQPNRSPIDTAPENIGRIQIFAANCSSDAKPDLFAPSIAEAAMRNIAVAGAKNVDMYATAGLSTIRRDHVEGDMRFWLQTIDKDGKPISKPVIRALTAETRKGRFGGRPTKVIVHRSVIEKVSVGL